MFSNNHRVQIRSESFAASLLSEAISDAFRHKAYLERRRVSLKREGTAFLDQRSLEEVAITCNQIFDNTLRENRPRLIKKFNEQRRRQEAMKANEETISCSSESSHKKVNNLSSLAIDDLKTSILAKGPHFAISQSISKNVLLEVEKSVERMGYAKRWKDDIDR